MNINFYPLLSYQIIILFTLVFIFLLVAHFYFSLKQFLFRISIFIALLILVFNPMTNSKEKSQYDDVLILVSDKTQSIIETNKLIKILKVKLKILTD